MGHRALTTPLSASPRDRARRLKGSAPWALFKPKGPSKAVGHEVWPAVSWQEAGQGTLAQGKCALGLIHAQGA